MPDAVVDYDLLNGKWNIVQQQNMLHERTRVLYGTANSTESPNIPSGTRTVSFDTEDTTAENDNLWNDLTEFYVCDYHEVSSHDGALVPLTVVYSRAQKEENRKPGLLHVHGAYGEMLDKRWRSELKSLLDRGWVLAYADVRSVPSSLLSQILDLLCRYVFIFGFSGLFSEVEVGKERSGIKKEEAQRNLTPLKITFTVPSSLLRTI